MERFLQRRWRLLGAAIVFGVGVLYVGGTLQCKGLGFPLDDGWIHQTYAQNLASTGQLAYVPGQVSLGSTSPLWTVVLALSYVLHLPPVLWSYVLGGAGWLATGWTAAALAQRLFPTRRSVALWVGLACLFEWHLAWAAFSGMETTLFCFLSLLLIERYAARTHPILLGGIGGLLFLTRPEGIVLVGLLAGVIALDRRSPGPAQAGVWARGLLVIWLEFAAGVAVLVLPYVVFNVIVSGQLLPNTFYAKQAEYHELLAQPLWARLWRVVRRPVIGAQALLIPGFVWQAIQSARARGTRALRLLPGIWWGVVHAIYALRMPVDYQYGRYLMPTIPFLLFYGVVGTSQWVRTHSHRLVVRLFSRAMPAAIGCLFVAFLILGQRAYVDDVCVINGEMVDVARWLKDHTPADALVAAHDIGAIGYLGNRDLLDLAGLITPEVIPFMRDEAQLTQYIVAQHADYLATFPSWYRQMTADERFVPVYQTDCAVTRRRGGENMVVYRIRE